MTDSTPHSSAKRSGASWVWLGAGIAVWLCLAGFTTLMAVASIMEDNLDWYYVIGPVIGALFVVLGGAFGITFAIRQRGS